MLHIYDLPFRAQCVEVRCPEDAVFDDLSDCPSTDWGPGLQKQTQHFVNLFWCWLQARTESNFQRPICKRFSGSCPD